MQENISFVLDGKIETIRFGGEIKPTTTVLNYLRKSSCHKGAKEGCAEGDCGACTVVLAELTPDNKLKYKAIDSCLVFLPMLHGKQLITVENLATQQEGEKVLHPVQSELVQANGSQCGFCSPGIIMSMFSLYKNENNPSKACIEDALTGNLCRCTGYKSIVEATAKSCVHNGKDHFSKDEAAIIGLLTTLRGSEKSLEIATATQQYFQPLTLMEAVELKANHSDAIWVNGGTDVGLRVTKRHELLEKIIDLSHIQELKRCTVTDTELVFGAGMSLEEVKKVAETELPTLNDTLTVFGSKQIREMASFGGNVGSSSPISDTLPILLVYDASIVLQSTEGKRIVKMSDYILGYRKTARKEEEIIVQIVVPLPSKTTHVKFYKISKRKDLDISTASAAFSLTLENDVVTAIKIAYGGMDAVARRVASAENFLLGKTWTMESVEEAMEIIRNEFTPLSDARSSAEFRTAVAKNLLLKFWSETSNKL